jgi:hypothetical protein
MPVPAQDLRSNIGTWAIALKELPSLAWRMTAALPTEAFDPHFQGQYLETTYFDTRDFALLKARKKASKYLTLRIRCYSPAYTHGTPRPINEESYALSAKTEDQKVRAPLESFKAETLLAGGPIEAWSGLLPGDLMARLLELVGDDSLVPVVTVCCRRYAVEDRAQRLTLDIDVRTDNGKCYGANVLEHKSTSRSSVLPFSVPGRPIKLSKFVWAMG